MSQWKPGPVVWAVFIAGLICVWVVIALHEFYDVVLEPVDVALNTAAFMTLAGLWTEWIGKK